MKTPLTRSRLEGLRFPREIISHAVRACQRFALSTAEVEDLPAARGGRVSLGTVRLWVNRLGADFADCIRRDRPGTAGKWHLDEVVIPIDGVKY